MTALYDLVEPWLLEADSNELLALHDQLVWLKKELFEDYEPNRYEAFDDRLAEWLGNLSEVADRKAVFNLLRYLFFVGKHQFDSLCRAAYSDDVVRWVIDGAGLRLLDPQLSEKISAEIRNTWCCPITDSMRINAFLKLNGLVGHDHRPDWRSLTQFGDRDLVRKYVTEKQINRVVLLEDFVGTGDQMRSTVTWAAETLPDTPILIVPLVCCPEGVRAGEQLASAYPLVAFAPTLILRESLFLKPTPQDGEPEVFALVRDVILRMRSRFDNWSQSPFGYGNTGALVALYSNCPDNTLPLIHYSGASWTPLFFRIRRN